MFKAYLTWILLGPVVCHRLVPTITTMTEFNIECQTEDENCGVEMRKRLPKSFIRSKKAIVCGNFY